MMPNNDSSAARVTSIGAGAGSADVGAGSAGAGAGSAGAGAGSAGAGAGSAGADAGSAGAGAGSAGAGAGSAGAGAGSAGAGAGSAGAGAGSAGAGVTYAGVNLGRVPVLCLAAGGSTRMGQAKQLLPWGNTTLLQAALLPYRELGLSPLVLVVGACSEQVLNSLEPALLSTCHIVNNAHWSEGMATSLAAGVRYLLRLENEQSVRFAGLLVALGDMPSINSSALVPLLRAFDQLSQEAIVAPLYSGRRGHPVIIGRAYWSEILELSGDRGASPLLKRYTDKVHLVETGEEVCQDIDTPEEWLERSQTGFVAGN